MKDKHLCSLGADNVDNSNIGKENLCKIGLHLNQRGSGKLVIYFIIKNKNNGKNYPER